jgi:saccharopine dehydrogenase (NAD+, L-lysine-forming)
MPEWMIYGANGYTGELVARRAVRLGFRPVLAGRSGGAIRTLAGELGLEHVVVALDDPAALRAALSGVQLVAHCAGPFVATSAPMVDACLATGTHYLDVTGEIDVFESIFARHQEAVAAGVVLVPGAGFDVVPTDCLAARLAASLPGASSLELAFHAGGGLSRGTARTALSGMAGGGRVRRNGVLVPTRAGSPRRRAPFPSGERSVASVRWGDLVTAFRSTGIPNITVYTELPMKGRGAALAGVLRSAPLLGLARRVVSARVTGPDADRRARSRSEVWGEVRDADGHARSGTLTGPNAYDLTADAVVRAVRELTDARTCPAPGAHTPSMAFGVDFAARLDGVRVSDIA